MARGVRKEKNNVSATLAMILLFLSIFVVVQLPLSVVANPGESVDVSFPSYSWWYPDHKPGDTVVMELKIENNTITQEPVKSFQANFSFDPAILYCIDVKEGLFLKGPYLNWSTTFTAGTINNTAGTVTGVNGTITQAGKNATAGFGVVAYVWFTVLRCGSSIIDLTACDVVKPDLSAISVTLVDGYFELGAKAQLPSIKWIYFGWNWETFWSMGDANRDGYIDDADAEIVYYAYAFLIYNPDADFNQDGIINIEDVKICDGNQGLDIWTYFSDLKEHDIGDEFCMNLTIKTAELYSWQTGLKFDPDVVNVVSITGGEGFYLNETGPVQWIYDSSYINNTAGTVKPFNCTLLGNVSAPATGPDGKVVATICFNVTGMGKTDIELVDFEALEVEQHHLLPLTLVDGYFELSAILLGSSISGTYPAHDIGDVFCMNLIIRTAELYSWQTGLKFDPDVVNVVSITGGEGFYLNETGPVQWIYEPDYINNTAGTVSPFGCTLLGDYIAPATGPDGAVIAIIWFNVTGAGNTAIELTDVKAYSSEIPVTTIDGYFTLGAEVELSQFVDSDLRTLPLYWVWKELVAVGPFSPLVIGDEFCLNLTIRTAELYSWQTGLEFDPDVVNVINITGGEGFYLNQFGPVQWIYDSSYINNTAGTVKTFGCTLLGDYIADETGPDGAVVANIWFNVTGVGSKPISLTDVKAFASELTLFGYLRGDLVIWGDLNRDNRSGSIADVTIMDRIYSQIPGFINNPYGDLNNDGRISIADAKLMEIIYSGVWW